MVALVLQPGDLKLTHELLHHALHQTCMQMGLSSAESDRLSASVDSTLAELSEWSGSVPEARNEEDLGGSQPHEPNAHAVASAESLEQLQLKIEEASKRVAKLRQEVPAALMQAAAEQLAAARPTLSAVTLGSAQASGEAVCEDKTQAVNVLLDGEPEMVLVQAAFAAALDKLPGLRAQMEQAVARLGSNLAASELEQSRPAPRTVERVLMDRPMSTPQ
mmetsp:Transcript_1288/g.2072  ORF Transcript_1288/g.2072 Transcript_1288/m.2072 type:complete len:219 (+) Transcript_1288:219-875(+)|eukprot:CAMPEP_0119109146 /NCGR_PEP_ID=MMETSP1180-20130426/17417_1 /TAXON_ID=3052 ORGANISM="Chlamydomonas cf sp, Strain CCMP681" /NCGR_SAMPLE_ID=MMETSP1180 /ASSEMBLY_ACC=CAM_ASM_000741 /LENGTH=218 /DNA_ID=CAMNT_0007094863 /DNA_START=147 /DNA_END=803 /DNA_ORIENTATION=-